MKKSILAVIFFLIIGFTIFFLTENVKSNKDTIISGDINIIREAIQKLSFHYSDKFPIPISTSIPVKNVQDETINFFTVVLLGKTRSDTGAIILRSKEDLVFTKKNELTLQEELALIGSKEDLFFKNRDVDFTKKNELTLEEEIALLEYKEDLVFKNRDVDFTKKNELTIEEELALTNAASDLFTAREYVMAIKLAAEKGSVVAQNNLGVIYYHGYTLYDFYEFEEEKDLTIHTLQQNIKEAIKWLKKSAEQENAIAEFNLGLIYLFGEEFTDFNDSNGEVITKDKKEAFKWIKRSAENGYIEAQYLLGQMYYFGEGIPKDFKEAFKWFELSAEQGNSDAQYNLGVMYYKGEGVTQNFKEAFKWYEESADKSNRDAQYNLGVMYYNGEGVAQDFKEAFEWFEYLAKQESEMDSQFNIGVMYYKGEGVTQNYKAAFKWFEESRYKEEAKYNLGIMYKNGQGVPQHFINAYKWINLYCTEDQKECIKIKNELAEKMTTDQIAEAQKLSTEWF